MAYYRDPVPVDDATFAIFLSQNNETAVMLVFLTNAVELRLMKKHFFVPIDLRSCCPLQ